MKLSAKATPNELLSHERERRNWTQEYVAEKIGADAKSVGRWERGIIVPSLYYRQKLCELFGKSGQELGLVREGETPYWYVPYRRNRLFTGRESVLVRLHETLSSGGAVALTEPQVLSGIGGIGKTQTALEYAYRFRGDYQAIFWARAETRETLLSDFVTMARLLNVPSKDEQDQNRVVEEVKRWLGEYSCWLLILDNVEELPLVEEFLPPEARSHLLLTTRAQFTWTHAQCIEIDKMELDEGALFLLRRARRIAHDASLADAPAPDRSMAQEIVQALVGLPLALDQAGAYIEETECTLSDYLERCKSRRALLLNWRGGTSTDHPDSVSTTLSLSFEKVERSKPGATDLLRVCAFLHPDAIPEEIIAGVATSISSPIQSVAADPFEFDAAIAALRRYSLVRRNPEKKVLAIHRLVQAVLQDNMQESEQKQWIERIIVAINAVFPEVEYQTWSQCESLIPHALMCAVQTQSGENTNLDLASLLFKTARYLTDRAQYAKAEPLYQRALRIREQALGPEHSAVADSLNSLAILFYEWGEFEEAETFYQRALQVRERALGPEHPEVASTLNSLANLYAEQGKSAEAEALYQRALRIRERELGLDHPEVASTLNNLGILCHERGKYEEAEALYQQSLCIWEQALGPEHPRVIFPLTNLANLYKDQGKYEQAEQLYQQSLRILEQALGPEHTRIAYSLTHLANLYVDQGRYEQAESLYQRALQIRKQALGPEKPQIANTLSYLGILYRKWDKQGEAEQCSQHALRIWEQALGPEHTDLADPLNNLAVLYGRQEKYSEAESLFQRALSIRERHFGQYHPEVAEVLYDFATFYAAQGHRVEAESLYQRALAIRTQFLGPHHPKTMETRASYAQLLRDTGRYDEASVLVPGPAEPTDMDIPGEM